MFHIIEQPWARQAHFRHYMDNLRCTYSLTVQIDITALRAALKKEGIRAYPAQIHLLAATVARFPQFRMGLSEAGEPGYWEELHPSYTILHRDSGTFSSIWTAFDADFSRFYAACTGDMARYAQSRELMPQGEPPPNCFHISSLPWIDFTAFNLNVYADGTHLLPIFTLGRYREQGGAILLPLALQLHHAACDGFHAGQFIEAMGERANSCRSWL